MSFVLHLRLQVRIKTSVDQKLFPWHIHILEVNRPYNWAHSQVAFWFPVFAPNLPLPLLSLILIREIGSRRGKKLLEMFKTPKAILEASLDDIAEVENVGREVAKRIIEGNPECLELRELITQAEDAIKKEQYDKAVSLADAAVQSCKSVISSKHGKPSIY